MKRLLTALGVAAALGLSITASVLADPTNPPVADHGPGCHKGHGGWLHDLNLTDDQKSQLKALHDQQRSQNESKMKDLMQAHHDLRAQVFSDNPDGGQIEALKAKITALQSGLLASRVETDKKVSAILTPDQRKKMATMDFPRGRHHRHHRSDFGGAPGPDPGAGGVQP